MTTQQWSYATNLKQNQGSSPIVCDSVWKSAGREVEAMPQDRKSLIWEKKKYLTIDPISLTLIIKGKAPVS